MDSGAPINAGRRGATRPSRFRDCGPGVREVEFCLSRLRRPAAARNAASQNRCVSPLAGRPAPAPVGHQRGGAALSSAFPHLAPDRSERTHATFAGFPRARRDGNVRLPHLFLDALSTFPPRLVFHLGQEPPETGRGGGRASLAAQLPPV